MWNEPFRNPATKTNSNGEQKLHCLLKKYLNSIKKVSLVKSRRDTVPRRWLAIRCRAICIFMKTFYDTETNGWSEIKKTRPPYKMLSIWTTLLPYGSSTFGPIHPMHTLLGTSVHSQSTFHKKYGALILDFEAGISSVSTLSSFRE